MKLEKVGPSSISRARPWGRVAGYSSDLARYIDDEVSIVIPSNVQSVARDEIRRLVVAAAFGEEGEVPGIPRRSRRRFRPAA